MIKFNKLCKVCAIIKAEGMGKNSLGKRIYESQEFVGGGEPLTEIQRAYKGQFGYQSLYNHVKKHQALTEKDLNNRAIARVAREVTVDRLKGAVKYQDLQQEVVDQVLERLREGQLKLSVKDGLQAAKQLSDKEDKQIDQQQEMMRMVALFASGELKPVLQGGGPVIEGELADGGVTGFIPTGDITRPD